MIFNRVNINCYKLNGCWLAPSIFKIFTPRSRNYVHKKFDNLRELINKSKLDKKDLIIYFNLDEDFSKFNICQEIRNRSFRISKKISESILSGNVEIEEIVPNVLIHWNYKSVQALYNGACPFYTDEWFNEFYENSKVRDSENKIHLVWSRYFGFKQFVPK
ncbi:hypothetical protein EI74_0010 [Mycoplasma testudineum]|uniref:Uncharacterized protein n=1 Tax=Mycoplasma testudineum TaxID=244584 RepID=A0A4R6IJI4_9MOLU|nr:hypothetical protein [Mycoplasma testudineum]OYD26451.1 hypothetical protein CG473_03870 [Mycoplasma testudineum]TDO22153.1 hypothetical protein EI74_0010 [Mycoplasma testudineum]